MKGSDMGISLSVLLITSGTVLAWGVDTAAAGF
jgi:hypothetical protein